MNTARSTHPLVSVLITTYNQAAYIEAAVQSALDQTFTDREVIVVDDGSTDDTVARLRRFGKAIRLYRQRNAGVAASRNTAVDQAVGSLLVFLDGDDFWHPEMLRTLVAAASRQPRSAMFAADGVQFAGTGSVLAPTLFRDTGIDLSSERSIEADDFHRHLLRGQVVSTVSQVMIRKAVLDEIGRSDPRYRRASDYDLYLRLAARHPVTLLADKLVFWRYLPTSASGPRELRCLAYFAEDLEILLSHRRSAGAGHGKAIDAALIGRMGDVAAALSQLGRWQHRVALSSALLAVLRANPGSLRVLLCLIGAWCPAWLGRPIARGARRAIGLGTQRLEARS